MATENDTTTRSEHAYYAALLGHGVPEHLHGGIVRYLVHRLPPGHFLMAVLSNNLSEAMNRADDESRAGLFAIVKFLYNAAPFNAWGNPDRVEDWLLKAEGRS